VLLRDVGGADEDDTIQGIERLRLTEPRSAPTYRRRRPARRSLSRGGARPDTRVSWPKTLITAKRAEWLKDAQARSRGSRSRKKAAMRVK